MQRCPLVPVPLVGRGSSTDQPTEQHDVARHHRLAEQAHNVVRVNGTQAALKEQGIINGSVIRFESNQAVIQRTGNVVIPAAHSDQTLSLDGLSQLPCFLDEEINGRIISMPEIICFKLSVSMSKLYAQLNWSAAPPKASVAYITDLHPRTWDDHQKGIHASFSDSSHRLACMHPVELSH